MARDLMSVAVLDIHTLRELAHPPLLSNVDPLGFEQRRNRIEAATEVIREYWNELPLPIKDEVVRYVRLLVDSPSLSFWESLMHRVSVVGGFLAVAYHFFVDKKSMHSYVGYVQSVDRLIQTVLDAVERENAFYQQAIQISKEEEGKELKGTTAGDFRDFLGRL
ncbi:hypothetical protein L6R29_22700 [Myxococcota bacterium]|nr:hypothetical protein [Myxococcota bacterium]